MSWKRSVRLGDLSPEMVLEATCLRCGRSRLRPAHELQGGAHDGLFLDELEQRLVCRYGLCHGQMRLALEAQGLIEGFVGGMP